MRLTSYSEIQDPITAAVAVSAPLMSALMAVGTGGSCSFRLDQGLQPLTNQFRNEFVGYAAAKQLRLLSGARIRVGQGLVSGRW
jgi:hypothetical protein